MFGPIDEHLFRPKQRRITKNSPLRRLKAGVGGATHSRIPCPADDEFLGVLVEIFLAERERVEAMKKLGKLLDANLDQLGSGGGDGSLMSASLELGASRSIGHPFCDGGTPLTLIK